MLTFKAFNPYAMLAEKTETAAKPAKDAKVDDAPLPTLAGLATLAERSAQIHHPATADWREFHDERAAVAEHTGTMPKDKAERMAYESCITRWLDKHPPAIIPDTCIHCGKPAGIIGQDAIITGSGHYFHHACHTPWLAQRRQSAIMALAKIGITEQRNIL